MKKKQFLFITYLMFIALSAAACPASSAEEDWASVIEGSYATIYVENGVNIKKAAQKIDVDFARYDPVEKEIFLERGVSEEQRLADKIDIIVRKARRILDMYPQNFMIDIKIYKDEQGLADAYKGIFDEEVHHKAFYIHKFNTVYISLDDLSESVLAHEIGHSVIDSYFAVLPPQKIRELLACYVDVHLKD